MTESDEFDKDKYAVAQLALQLSDKSVRSETNPPSDEDLAAFYDNQLNEEQRQRILFSIVNHKETYSRWVQLVDTLGSNIDIEEKSEVKIPNPLSALLEKVKNWCQNGDNFSNAFGSGLATAMVILFAVLLIPTQKPVNLSDKLSEYYENIAINIANQSLQKPGLADLFSEQRSIIPDKEKAEFVKIMQTGFLVGAQDIQQEEFAKWGYPIKSFSVVKPSELNKLTIEEYNNYFELGRLAAITALPCAMNTERETLIKLYPIAQSLLTQENVVKNAKIMPLLKTLLDKKNKVSAVCSFNEKIKTLLIG